MYSFPGETSTGTMCPGNLVANATSPATPVARYSVIKIDPPPATRLITPNKPPPPANCVCVVISIELPIHESSPASEMTDSLGSRTNSKTGIVVPVMRDCMMAPRQICDFENCVWRPWVRILPQLCHPERSKKVAKRASCGVEGPAVSLRCGGAAGNSDKCILRMAFDICGVASKQQVLRLREFIREPNELTSLRMTELAFDFMRAASPSSPPATAQCGHPSQSHSTGLRCRRRQSRISPGSPLHSSALYFSCDRTQRF